MHETDDRVIAHDQVLNNAKRQLSDDPTKAGKRLYDQQVALAHRNAGTRGGRDRSPPVPEFSFADPGYYRKFLMALTTLSFKERGKKPGAVKGFHYVKITNGVL